MKKLSLIVLIALSTLAFKCDKPFIDDNLRKIAKTSGVITSNDSVQKTPKGAVVRSSKAESAEILSLIDEGITERQNDAVTDGFKEELKKPHSFYEIRTPALGCVPSPEQHIPSFMTGGGWFYDGTEYDQYNPDGKLPSPIIDPVTGNRLIYKKDGLSAIFAAEMVIGSDPGVMIACPDTSVIKDAVANGVDHIWLMNYAYSEDNRTKGPYDGWLYCNETVQHSTGKGHPLLPRNAPESLSGRVETERKEAVIIRAVK